MSIRTKLIAIMLFIGILPTLIVSIVAFITISQTLTRKTADQLISATTEQEQRVATVLQTRQEEATDLTNEYDIQNLLWQFVQSKGANGADQLSSLLTAKKVLNPSIQSIYIVGLDGKTIATTVSGDNGHQFDPSDFKVPDGQQTAMSIREDGWDSVDKLYITTPISIAKQPSAYLRVIFYTDDIVAILQDYTGLGATGETLVADRDGAGNAVSLFPLRFDTAAALTTKLNSLDLFSSYGGGYKTLPDYRGHIVMIAATPLGYGDWVIATKIDQAEALAQIESLRTSLLWIAVISTVLIIAIALYCSSFFTRPIRRIAEVARRIGTGDFSSSIDMKRRDEIGSLANNINHMGQSLRSLVEGIEAQRNRLATVLNSTNESILAVDRAGKIVMANEAAAALIHLPVSSIVGQGASQLLHWTKEGKPVEVDYSPSSTKVYGSLDLMDRSDQAHYVKVVVAPIKAEPTDASPQAIVTIHDETKSRELEAMKIDFVSMAAHELRTPLAAIRGYLELIMYKVGLNEVAGNDEVYLRQALNSTDELSGLINNLLDVTRIEKGRLNLRMERLDLATSAYQAVQDSHFAADDKRITLTYDGPHSGCFVLADQIALHEVLNNLITNAIKYTERGGTVNVSLKQEGDAYTVAVKDTGIGIAKAAQANIFTKFYRAQSGLSSGNTGTGLGLFISKSIIERHNGHIGFTSQEGVGSTFSFSLPIYVGAGNEPEDQTNISAMRRQKRGWITKNIAR